MRALTFLLLFAFASYNIIVAQSIDECDEIATFGPGSYKTENGRKPIHIPFTWERGKPLFHLKINNRDATLMIDNGVLWNQVWLFGSPLVEQIGLKPIDEGEIGGSGEGDPTAAYTSDNLTLSFNGIDFYEQPVLVSPPAAGFNKMFPGVDGQLCNTFFGHFIVQFDFEKDEVVLHNPNSFKFESDGSVIEMRPIASGGYAVPFSFTMNDGTVYSGWIDIDFGGIYPIKIALNNGRNIQLPENATETRSFGAQGKNTEYKSTIKSMTWGKYTFKNPPAIFGNEGTSRIHPENLGVIGLPLFMRFHIYFDYFNSKIYIEPNKNFDKPFE